MATRYPVRRGPQRYPSHGQPGGVADHVYRVAVDRSPTPTAVVALDGRFRHVNPAMCAFLGYDAATLQTMTWHQLTPADQLDADLVRGEDLLAGRIASYTTVKQYVRAGGGLVWAEMTASVVRDPEGQPECLISHLVAVGAATRADGERELARRRAVASDALYRRSMDSAAIGMSLCDLDGHFIDVNPALCEFLGYDSATLKAKTWQELTAAEYLPADIEHRDAVLAGRIDSYRMVKQYIHADGHLIWGDLAVGCVRAPDGHVEVFIAQITDITSEVQTREQLDAARRRQAATDALYRRSMDSAAVGMCLCDDVGTFLEVNPAICAFFGYDAETLKSKTWQELTVEGYLEVELPQRDQLIAGRIESYRMTKEFIHADGHRIWGDLSVSCVRAADGTPEIFIGQIVDVTAEIRTRRELEEARRRQAAADALYRRSMDSAAVGMCLVDPGGNFVDVNPAICAFFGYDAETLKHKTWQEITAAEYLQADLDNVADVLAGRTDSYRMVKQYLHADGHRIWGDLSVGCVRGADGQVEFLIKQVNDITDEVEIREQLAKRDQQNRVLAQRLSAEIDTAAAYVTSTLPGELRGPVTVSSSYRPSQELGGDCFNYAWLDEDLLEIYLIDVSGHGLGPALLSMSVHNLLRSGSLPTTTLLRPDRVLAELNALFPMEDQGGNYFTIWYGIYDTSSRMLRYASGGHQPALAFTTTLDGGGRRGTPLGSSALPVGMFADTKFEAHTYSVPPGCRMLLFSDGAYEFTEPDGTQFDYDGFAALATQLAGAPDFTADAVLSQLVARTADGVFDDDCSLIAIDFG